MAIGESAVCRTENITATGSGLARINDKCVFTELSAPGDLIRIRITEEQKNWARAEITEILEPSPDRTEPFCPLYGICGGCNLQHINYEAQLKIKKHILLESFSRTAGISPPEPGVYSSTPAEYRNRVQFHCAANNRKQIGFKAGKGNQIVQLADCPVADPGIREALKNPRQTRLNPPVHKDRFTVYSRRDLFLSEGAISRGIITLGDSRTGFPQKSLAIDAGVFFQSNAEMLEILLNDLILIAKTCDPGLPMADIYCGVGTFSAFIGDYFDAADLVEENKTAIALARENAQGKNRGFFGLKADDWVKQKKPFEKNWGLVILDPPRTGLTPGLRRFLETSAVKTIAYVSCDPVTLARDSETLLKAGYIIKDLNLYDFYPQTAHIESLTVFEKAQI